jgi:hypothetical protein
MLYNKQGITQLPPKTIICHLKLGDWELLSCAHHI